MLPPPLSNYWGGGAATPSPLPTPMLPSVSRCKLLILVPGRVAQSVGHLTRKSGVLGSIPVWPHTFVFPSSYSRGAVVSYWRKYVHEVLVNRLGGLSLPRKSVVRVTDRPDMTLDVYSGRKTTTTTTDLVLLCSCIIVVSCIIAHFAFCFGFKK